MSTSQWPPADPGPSDGRSSSFGGLGGRAEGSVPAPDELDPTPLLPDAAPTTGHDAPAPGAPGYPAPAGYPAAPGYAPPAGYPTADAAPAPQWYGQAQGYPPPPGYDNGTYGHAVPPGYDNGTYGHAVPPGYAGYPGYVAYPMTPSLDKGARTSLVLAIVGIFICGILLEPCAIYEGVKARKRIRESNGMLTGDGLALAGIIIGCVALALSVIGVILIVTSSGNTSTRLR